MLKKTITYKNPFTEEEVTQDFYFNINKAEVAKMAMVEGDGFEERLQSMVATNDMKSILESFERLVSLGYGKREGDEFVKSPELSAKFIASEAYSELFLELVQDTDKMSAFFNGMLPADLHDFVNKSLADREGAGASSDPNDKRPAWIRENREPTQSELSSMTKSQLVEVMQRKNRG